MKKIYSIFMMLLFVINTEAQTIHWLTFVDTTDKEVGKIDITGHKVLYDNFINEVNAALAEKGYESDVQDFTGTKVSPENCKSAVNLLRVQSDDIIVFYYIGHGGRPNTLSGYVEQHPFPHIYLAQHDAKKCVPLEEIHEKLSAKGARLVVTIGMACNSLDDAMPTITGPTFAVNYGASNMNPQKLKLIQELFLNVKGNVIATSSLPTQTSKGATTIFGAMDFYSAAICQIFKNELSGWNNQFTWETFLDRVEKIVTNYTRGSQTPFYIANLTTDKQPSPSPTPKPVPPPAPSPTRDINILTNTLTRLASPTLPDEKRFELERKLNNLFAPSAIVKFLPQDGTTVIDTETADVFLGRLATTNIILKVIVYDAKFRSDNKITELRVKETYRQNITD